MRRKKKLDEEEEQIAQLEKELEKKKPKPGDTRKNGLYIFYPFSSYLI